MSYTRERWEALKSIIAPKRGNMVPRPPGYRIIKPKPPTARERQVMRDSTRSKRARGDREASLSGAVTQGRPFWMAGR